MASKPRSQWSAAYRRRIERAEAQGKTRQQARGHTAHEHIERAQKEREELGLSRAEIESIRRWVRSYKNESRAEEDVISEARDRGYVWFQDYRAGWNAVRRQYIRELKHGKWASRGEGFLASLTDQWEVPEMSWAYYH